MVLYTESMARNKTEDDNTNIRQAQTKTYLIERWQETIDLMASMYDATILCFRNQQFSAGWDVHF